ncbi:MAG: hypothetical protein ABH833_00155 [Parcubacteria group bacterium]
MIQEKKKPIAKAVVSFERPQSQVRPPLELEYEPNVETKPLKASRAQRENIESKPNLKAKNTKSMRETPTEKES